jgi:putative transferase (TIGR04331 family)
MSKTLIFSKKNFIDNKKKKILIGEWLLLTKKQFKNYEVFIINEKNKDKLKDFEYVKKTYESVLKNITPLLNSIHKKKYKKNDWEVLIFYFLSNYIFTAYDKWKLIKKLKKKYNFDPVEIFNSKKYSFLQEDTKSFFYQLRTDEWDDWLNSRIIKAQNLDFVEKKIYTKEKYKKDFDNLNKLKFQKFFQIPDNKYFIKNIVLPKLIKIKLSLNLNKNIGLYNDISFRKNKNFSNKRNLFELIKCKDSFEKFIYNSLSELFPKNFIENFNFIEKNIKFLNWPKKPKIILTSYEHYFNDVFKIYTMNKKRKGSKFYILQHGYQGHNDFCATFYEKKVCTKYLSWGNTSEDKKNISLFCTTTFGKKIKKNIKKDILISYTEFSLKPWKQQIYPRLINETKIYKDDLINLISLLNKNKTEIDLKYYNQEVKKYITDEIERKFKKINFITIDKTKRGFEFSNKYKLIIETTNSTGFIEMLSLNIPVILITNKKFFNVKKEYKKYYDELIKSNIIFFDVNKASNFINSNLNNINNWWFNELTQKRIKYFSNYLCKYEENYNVGLEKIIKKIK